MVGATAAAEGPATDESDRQRVDVTVYNQDLALVREIRAVELPEGSFQLEFQDVPARIDPTTLLVNVAGRTGLELLEQNYEFDLMSRDKILQKYVGKRIAWIQEDSTRIEGTLLGIASGPVYEVAGEVVFEVPGRMALPALPENLRARPTLVWQARTERSGEAEIEASYLTGGFSWHADYVLHLDEKGERAGLQAWVTVENRTGASFREANLLLVAGDINRARPRMMMEITDSPMAMKAGGRGGFVEESLYDYHLYTLQRPTTLLNNQIKQVSLFEADGIEVTKHYRLKAAPGLFRGSGSLHQQSPVEVSYSFENKQDNQLGMPLPAGTFRVYGRSESGARQLLGEDRIGHTPTKEEIDLTVGKAFDIVAERVRTDARRVADNVHRSTFEITLRNHRDEDVVVEVLEQVGGYWEVVQSSQDYRKVSASELAYDVAVPSDGETVLTYTVEVKY